MKKVFMIAALFIISALTICGCGGGNTFKNISLSEIETMLSDGENVFVLYAVEDCSACDDAKEKLSQIRKIYPELNLRCIDGDSEDGRLFSKEYDIPYAPYLICIKNGECFLFEDFTEEKLNNLIGLTKDSETDRFENIRNIKLDSLYELMETNTDFLLYIGRDNCRDCQKFHPIVENMTEEKYGLYYFDIKEYKNRADGQDALQDDIDTYNKIKKDFSVNWIPSVYRIINGTIVDKYVFLDNDYYSIEDEEEQEKYLDEYIEQFRKWMDKNF